MRTLLHLREWYVRPRLTQTELHARAEGGGASGKWLREWQVGAREEGGYASGGRLCERVNLHLDTKHQALSSTRLSGVCLR